MGCDGSRLSTQTLPSQLQPTHSARGNDACHQCTSVRRKSISVVMTYIVWIWTPNASLGWFIERSYEIWHLWPTNKDGHESTICCNIRDSWNMLEVWDVIVEEPHADTWLKSWFMRLYIPAHFTTTHRPSHCTFLLNFISGHEFIGLICILTEIYFDFAMYCTYIEYEKSTLDAHSTLSFIIVKPIATRWNPSNPNGRCKHMKRRNRSPCIDCNRIELTTCSYRYLLLCCPGRPFEFSCILPEPPTLHLCTFHSCTFAHAIWHDNNMYFTRGTATH